MVFSPDRNYYDISLYINGLPNTSGSIANYDPFLDTDISVGKYRRHQSFKGAMGELFVFHYPLSKEEVFFIP